MNALGGMFPGSFPTAFVGGSGAYESPTAPLQWKVYNRTGAATVVGQLMQFDLALTAAAETTANSRGVILAAVANYKWMDDASPWRNVVVPVAPYFAYGYGCVAEQAVADNEELLVTVIGDTYMRIGTVQGGTGGSMLITGMNWTDASKTLTKANAFTNFVDPGSLVGIISAQINLTAGTGVTTGLYTIATKTDASNITLSTDINGAGGNIADTSVNGEIYLTYPAGSKIEMATAVSYGNLTNGTATNRKVAILAEQTIFRDDLSTTGGRLTHVYFNGFGFSASKL
jgi:hypothetical protein